MAVARTSVSSAMASGTAGITATFGTGAAAGNFGLLIVESANETPTTPTGWTSLGLTGNTFGTAGTAGASGLYVFKKQSITSGDISGGIAVADTGDHTNAILLTYSGVDATTPIFYTTSVNSISAAATSFASFHIPLATGVGSGMMLVAITGTDRDSGTAATLSGAGFPSAVPTTATLAANFSSASGAGGGIIVYDSPQTGTQTGDIEFDLTLTSTALNNVVLALQPPVSGTTVTPSTGHLVLTGYLPTITKAFNIAPSAGHLVLGGKVATVTKTLNIAPATGHLVLAGHIPSVSVGTSVSPLTGHLTLAGHAPSVTLTVNVAPATGHLTLGGKVAVVSTAFNLSPSTGHLSLGGKVPTVTLAVNISPITGHLLLTGYAPTVDNGGAVIPTILPIKVTYRHRGRNC